MFHVKRRPSYGVDVPPAWELVGWLLAAQAFTRYLLNAAVIRQRLDLPAARRCNPGRAVLQVENAEPTLVVYTDRAAADVSAASGFWDSVADRMQYPLSRTISRGWYGTQLLSLFRPVPRPVPKRGGENWRVYGVETGEAAV